MKSIIQEFTNSLYEISNLEVRAEELCKFFNIDIQFAPKIHLCIDEILTNIINYGYPDKREGKIVIESSFQNNILKISISDDAILFNPLNAQEPVFNLPLEERKIGGLGVYFVKQLTNNQYYSVKNGQNNLIIEFLIESNK
jgi:serine/threonine-protein kinase RsbW